MIRITEKVYYPKNSMIKAPQIRDAFAILVTFFLYK